jgi:hypothetical protein
MTVLRLRWLRLVGALVVAAVLSCVGPAAAAKSPPNLSGTWTVTNKSGGSTALDSYVFKLTSPNAYSISDGENFTALDVVVKAQGSGAFAVSYWCGVPTATAAGCPSNDALFVVKMHFRFPHTGHPTYTGTIVETANGKFVQQWTTAATQTTGTCVVPNVKGDTLTAAEHAIAQAWCRPGTVTQAKSTTVKTGEVISQTAVGSKGPTVRLKISKANERVITQAGETGLGRAAAGWRDRDIASHKSVAATRWSPGPACVNAI